MTGSRQRYYALIKHLSRYHHIYLLSIIRSPRERDYIPAIEKYCHGIDTVILEKRIRFRALCSVLSAVAHGLPLYNSLMTSPELKKKICYLCQTWGIDVVHIEHIYMAHYIHALPPGMSFRKVLTYNDIVSIQNRRIFRIERNILHKFGYLLNSVMMRSYEVKIGLQFDICLTVSQQDKAFLEKKNPHFSLSYLPNGTDTNIYTPLPLDATAKDIIFVGTFRYAPNVDAVLYFYHHIFLKIVNVLSDTEFWIVGPDPPPPVAKLARNPQVRVTGYVNDLGPYYRKAGVAVAPLRAGGGTRLKILEAMALGRPVVSTSIGCEGLDVVDG
ncbi:glycosyltransferase [Candidatus Latescibacterota bacterium]